MLIYGLGAVIFAVLCGVFAMRAKRRGGKLFIVLAVLCGVAALGCLVLVAATLLLVGGID